MKNLAKYTIQDLLKDFPNDDACLKHIFKRKYPNHKGWYKVDGRKCYVNKRGEQIYPLKGTIFEKSRTPLTLWFYAIFLFSKSKHGISAAELQRHLGVTYKTAFRMCQKIRSLMGQSGARLKGVVEVDETYFGGRHRRKHGFKYKKVLFGAVERDGRARINVIPNRETHIILNSVREMIDPKESHIMSDEAMVYKKLHRIGYSNSRVKHSKYHWVNGETHTNTVEGLWCHLKGSLKSTYYSVSPDYLQTYADEVCFRHNYRDQNRFEVLLSRV